MAGLFDDIYTALFDWNGDGKVALSDDLNTAIFMNLALNKSEPPSPSCASGWSFPNTAVTAEPEDAKQIVDLEAEALEEDETGLERERLRSELTDAGLDLDELCWMDENERNEAIEDAGLYPFDYEELFF